MPADDVPGSLGLLVGLALFGAGWAVAVWAVVRLLRGGGAAARGFGLAACGTLAIGAGLAWLADSVDPTVAGRADAFAYFAPLVVASLVWRALRPPGRREPPPPTP